jgi:RNA polymerase sigma factor (sigma-70 family)
MQAQEGDLRALMIASLDGDAAAYRVLLETISWRLSLYFQRRLSRDPAEVDDLVQETLMAIHNRRGTYDRSQMFTAWIFAIARYKLVDHFRRSGRKRSVPLDDAAAIPTQDERAGGATGATTLFHGCGAERLDQRELGRRPLQSTKIEAVFQRWFHDIEIWGDIEIPWDVQRVVPNVENFVHAAGTIVSFCADRRDDRQYGIVDRIERLSNQGRTNRPCGISATQGDHAPPPAGEYRRRRDQIAA